MVTDARGHEVPADSDMWGYREDMGLLSASIASVRAVADTAAAEAAIADLVATDLDPTGTVWWLATPGALYAYDGGELVPIATKANVDDLSTDVDARLARLPYAMATGTRNVTNIAAGAVKAFAITFPTGRFSSAPVITLGMRTAFPNDMDPGYDDSTPAGFTLYFYNGKSGTVSAQNVSWHAIQLDAAPARFTAEADVEPDALVTCPTDGCGNRGIAIPIVSTWTDEDGTTRSVDGVYCGVCDADITDTLQATS